MHKILALPGDGIGNEVMNSALDVLDFLKTRNCLLYTSDAADDP